MSRALRPRGAVSVAAALVSQLTCLPLLGVDPRRYLDHVVPLCAGHVTHLGRLRLVAIDVAVEALRRMARTDETTEPPRQTEERQPETAAGVLAAIGLEVAQ